MSDRIIYLNGAFVPESEAKVSMYDLSVMQGAAAFEMTRSFHHQHFKLPEHLDRLRHSCELLHIPLPADFDLLYSICQDVTERNHFPASDEHRLLIVVSPGCAPIYKDLDGVIRHSYSYVTDFPLRYTVAGMGRYFTEGVHCVTSKVQQVPTACVPSAAKHRSRLHFHLAQMEAPKGTWPLLLNFQGYYNGRYTEAPGANIVYVVNRRVYPIEEAALPGISMQTVKELVPTEEDPNTMKEVADEIWLTGTPFCMLPVVSLDGRPIGTGKPGPIYKKTLKRWNELVGLNIAKQIKAWG